MPGYIESVQRMLDQVESTVEEIDAKRETLRQILSRPVPVE
jgi:prefoldin subunit 5